MALDPYAITKLIDLRASAMTTLAAARADFESARARRENAQQTIARIEAVLHRHNIMLDAHPLPPDTKLDDILARLP
jgi:hypothetical protein